MKTIRDFDVKNKNVLVRCGFNVPLSQKGNILDDFRIRKTIPAIEHLIKKGAKVVLMSHLGRPAPIFQRKIGEIQNPKSQIPNKSKIPNPKKKYTLKPVALRLGKLLKKKVRFLPDCIGEKVEKVIGEMKAGDLVLLENLRFYKGETENNPKFAKSLAKLGDIFIQDAFGVCHRKHASIVGVPKYLPSGIGFLVEKEINVLNELRKSPKKPLVIIVGGKKVKTKVKLINKISKNADKVLLGHLIEKEIKEKNIKLKAPEKIIAPIDSLSEQGKDLDIGPKTLSLFRQEIFKAKTIFWNGQLGLTEQKRFTKGSLEIARAIIKSGAYSIVGGGDTIAFLGQNNLRDKFNFVSTGGGAMLAFLSNEKLPGIEVLRSKLNIDFTK